ncbi:retron Ec48 family effector membrane protein [Rheinheimera sp. F8]|uniref:retron Ec48 family effector membrane protein n=1 Tax=Rheinheimera sp. F8 TaxID=1763998 RepID=UPI000B1D0A29|nr:retron Ec48 family effector membrane protein [Rheinheimera sp. F8]
MSIIPNNISDFKNLLKILAIACSLLMCFLVALLIYGVYEKPELTFAPCLTEKCISNFSESFKVTLSLFPLISNVLVFCVALFGVIFAYQQYDLSKKSSNFSNHIVNMGHFNAILRSYLESCTHIRMSDVNVNTLYSLVYPESKIGNFAKFDGYLGKVSSFRRYLIDKSNGVKDKKVPYISSKKSFFNHRSNLNKYLEGFGISLASVSEAELYEIENEVLKFIDSITLNFTDETRASYQLMKVERHYSK